MAKNPFQKELSEKKLADLLSEDKSKEKEFNKKTNWYYGKNANRKTTEKLLEGSKSGSFLVRDSFSSAEDYVLSVNVDGKVVHYRIIKHPYDAYYHIDSKTQVVDKEIHGLENLISDLQKNPEQLLKVKLLHGLSKDPPPPDSRKTGRTNILHQAIAAGVECNVLKLLRHEKFQKSYVNSKNSDGVPALHLACEAGMKNVVERLIERKANVAIKNTDGFNALHMCCKRNLVDVARLLLEKGRACPMDICKQTKLTSIHIAAQNGSLDCVKLLLEHGSPDRPRDKDSNIPYDLALQANQKETAEYLNNYQATVPKFVNMAHWYHKHCNRQQAEQLLHRFGADDGLFLVRKSSKGETHALSVCYDQDIFHFEIKTILNTVFYIDQGPLMTSMEAIVYHYTRFDNGLRGKLKTALSEQPSLRSYDDMEDYPVEVQTPTNQETGSTSAPLPPLPTPRQKPSPVAEEQEGEDLYDDCENFQSYATNVITPARPGRHSSMSNHKMEKDDPLNKYLIKPEDLDLTDAPSLGEGEYGSVLKASLTEHGRFPGSKKKVPVAVKTLRDAGAQSNKDQFLSEARVMCELDHINIVKLIGVCFGGQLMIVQELCKMGSLIDYLWDNAEKINVDSDVLLWAAQVANGMMFLEEKKLVHRDLAARNILLASKTEAKISDFGLSRAINNSYSDQYEASKGGRWPVRWYAPECLNYGRFSSASDVWSYGITLYEMYTFGELPYGEMTGPEVIAFLDEGKRLEKPEKCPDAVYKWMYKCWLYNSKERPTFKELYNEFYCKDVSATRAINVIKGHHEKRQSRILHHNFHTKRSAHR